MRHSLLAVSALCLIAGAGPLMAQGAQDTTSRRQNEAPVSAQDPPAMPETPSPGDTRDYQTPAPASPATPGTPPGVPTPDPSVPRIPPGAPETPSTSPTTDPSAADPSMVEPSAGGGIPQDAQRLDKFLEQEGNERRQLVGRPVATLGGETVGTISEFVTRDSRHYAHVELTRTPDSPQRDVVVGLDKLHARPGDRTVVIEAQTRSELDKLPRYDPNNFQTVR